MTSTLIDIPALHATSAAAHLSGRYHFYSTSQLIEPLLADHWEVTQASQVRSKHYNPHGKHLVRITHEKLQLGADRLEAVIRNSHDGTSKLEVMLGAWRFVCSNGIFVGTEFARAAIQHTRAFEYVQNKAEELITHAPQVAAVFDAWKSRDTTEDERLALAVSAAQIRWNHLNKPEVKLPIEPKSLLDVRRHEDRHNDLWTVFNRIQENVMTGGISRLNDRRRVRGIRAIDETVRINKALWAASEAIYGPISGIALAS